LFSFNMANNESNSIPREDGALQERQHTIKLPIRTRKKMAQTQSQPEPPQAFTRKKAEILSKLNLPDSDYTDASPKGSVDEGIKDLLTEINKQAGLVTTSSCAGRISIFLEGRRSNKRASPEPQGVRSDEDDGVDMAIKIEEITRAATVAGAGGKGGGGRWLFVSHDPVELPHAEEETLADQRVRETLGLKDAVPAFRDPNAERETRYIHFKFEPMVRSESHTA
jgi:tRNA wybutosine-synthesizing protein 3